MTHLPAAAMSLLALPFVPGSVPVARRAVRAALEVLGVPVAVVRDVEVVVAELVGNSVRHARPLPEDRVQVLWQVSREGVVLGVSDAGSSTRPRVTAASMAALGGRGLAIVDSLTDEWWVTQENALTTVWVRMSLDTAGSQQLALH